MSFLQTTKSRKDLAINFYSNSSSNINQAKFKKNTINNELSDFFDKLHDIKQRISKRFINKYCNDLPKTKKAILQELVYFTKKYETAYPSQELISKKAGCSRQYVNETISEFQSAGILLKRNLPWRSCLYVLHPYLYSIEFRKRCDEILLAENKDYKKKTTPISISSYSLFLNKQLPICTKEAIAYVEESLQRKILKKKVETMSVTQKLKSEFNFGNYELQQLARFDEKILQAAYGQLKKRTNVKSPFKILQYICQDLVEESNKAAINQSAAEPAAVKIKTRQLEEDEYTIETLREIERKIRTFQSAINQCTDTRLKEAYSLSLEDYKKKVIAIQQVLAGTELKSENEIQAEKYEYAANHIRTNHASSFADLKHAGELEQKAIDLRNALPKEVTKRGASSLKNIYTPQEMANEISIFMDEEHLKHAAKLMGLTEAIKFRDTCLRNLLRRRIGEPIDGNDHIAMTVINKHRDRLAISPKFKPQSLILNENAANNINTHPSENHSPNANVVDILNDFLNTPIKGREPDLSNNQHSFVTGHILTKQSNFEYYSDQYEEILD